MLAKTGKSQEVNGIMIIIKKTSHALSLILQVRDFQAVASSYCLCSKQLYVHYRFMMHSDAFCTFYVGSLIFCTVLASKVLQNEAKGCSK